MSSDFRIVLRPPSAPITQSPRKVSNPFGPSAVTVALVGVLGHSGYPSGESHLDIGKGFKPLDAHARQLVLLGLHDKRIRRLIAQQLVIELNDASPRRLVPKLKIARHETLP